MFTQKSSGAPNIKKSYDPSVRRFLIITIGVVLLSSTTLVVHAHFFQGTPKPQQERRSFLRRHFAAPPPRSSASSVSSSVSSAVPPDHSYLKKRGVYLTAGSVQRTQFLDDTIEDLLASAGNALVMDVKGSYVYFHSTAVIATEKDLIHPLYDLPAIVQKAKERGIYTIARYIAVKDQVFSTITPEAQIKHPVTGRSVGAVWIDPSHPTALEYNRQIFIDLVQSGIDEVNLDYIRFPTEYPQSLASMTGDQKADKVIQFIQMAREVINQYAPQVKLGISTYAILGWNFPINHEHLGQDFVRFAPYVDVISPMAYPDSFAQNAYYTPGVHPRSRNYWLVYRTMKGYSDLLGDQSYKLRPWIQGYNMTYQGFRDEIDAVYDSGACGFTIWSAGNKYGTFYSALKDHPVPEKCM